MMATLKRLSYVMTMSALIVALGFATVLVLLWNEHERILVLPSPTGPFAVGRTRFTWADPAHRDEMAPKPGAPCELAVWIWYPASKPGQVVPADYLPTRWRAAVERERPAWANAFIEHDIARVRTHSVADSPLTETGQRFPVVILRAGLSALIASYTVLAEELASRGYVVVGFDAPYRTTVVVLPDGSVATRVRDHDPEFASNVGEQTRRVEKLLAAWTADTIFVLDRLEQLDAGHPSSRFAGRLDLQRVGVAGHSLGGAVALQFCHKDSRCKVGIDIDGAPYGSVVREGLHNKPFMFLLSDHGTATDTQSRRIENDIHPIYDSMPADDRLALTIPGANHYGFSDGVLLKSQLLQRLLRAVGVMGMGAAQQLDVTREYVGSFFDVYLNGAPVSSLKERIAHDARVRKATEVIR